MRSITRSGIGALTGALVLAAGGAVVILPAAAEPTTEFISAGTVTLTTGAVDAVSFGEGESATVQDLATAGDCNLLDPAGSLLQFGGYLGAPGASGTTTPPVGFKNDSIGVNEEIDSLCYRVDTTSRTGKPEYLDVKLSPALTNFAGRPLLASTASLDIEVKQAGFLNRTKAKVEAVALRDGNPVGAFSLVQGSGTNTASTTYCNVGDQGNCRLTITPNGYFDTIRLKAAAAGFSLEGGSDSDTSASTFELVSEVDKVLTCEDPTLVDGNTTVKYVGNADPVDPCGVGFGAVLTSADTEVKLLKPRNVDPSAQFVFDIDWKVANTERTPSPTIPDTIIDFEIGGDVEETALQFCSIYPSEILTRNPVTGDLEIVSFSAFNDDDTSFPDFDGDSPEKEFACIDMRTNLSITSSHITYSDRVFAIGDLKMTPR